MYRQRQSTSKLTTQLNKLFKSDSARVAFLLCVSFSGLGGMRRLGYACLTP
ncbi:DUF3265 domain-containing protein [Vibrio parahaemolyticus]|nr:DUF3265 domain-containing protein [Vibrio parahaemolyticus]